MSGFCIEQSIVQRFFSLPNFKAVKQTLIIFTIGVIVLLSLCMYLGVLAYAANYDCDPITTGLAPAKDQVVPLYVMQVVGNYPGMPGIFIAAVFSAALSSLSTVLNSVSGVILKDLIEPYRSEPLTERQTAYVLRAVVVIFGLASIFLVPIVQHLGLVMQLSATVNSIAVGPLVGVFTVGMLIPFVNTNSMLTGCIAGYAIMGYIAIRAQFAIAAGELVFPTKPVSIEGCGYDFLLSAKQNSSIYDAPVLSTNIGIHHMSFLWYSGVGVAITIIGALLATLYFGTQDTSELDPILFVPFVRRYLKPSKYAIVEDVDKKSKLCEHTEKFIHFVDSETIGITEKDDNKI